LQNGQSLKTEV